MATYDRINKHGRLTLGEDTIVFRKSLHDMIPSEVMECVGGFTEDMERFFGGSGYAQDEAEFSSDNFTVEILVRFEGVGLYTLMTNEILSILGKRYRIEDVVLFQEYRTLAGISDRDLPKYMGYEWLTPKARWLYKKRLASISNG